MALRPIRTEVSRREAPDDHSLPLQLLARELEFTDPLSGMPRRFVIRRTLGEAPVSAR